MYTLIFKYLGLKFFYPKNQNIFLTIKNILLKKFSFAQPLKSIIQNVCEFL